ncbi:hypothetical protein EJ070_06045 [Mesorhizobium sp. M1E.F.Ca.ET.045.02.1.1]|uniref:hypothetical protein n=1 Tax=unclassified Mesorhizobium TaxID=325217 RepID=UPI000F74F9F6|nr:MULTISPECIES: hypothetical protein [unclassified Mesorhizobium]AZO20267.1 hypothetical protein EJ070_06045 [Mesorhizobium sp. M1E.F.Ca.ET.045.02.1.1]RUW79566.1 hypothetical protein EOA29_23880 [Mesorhizobium sp. M1E.F.Ca.ET.063.01.1.1]
MRDQEGRAIVAALSLWSDCPSVLFRASRLSCLSLGLNGWRRPSSGCRHLLPVKDGEKDAFIDGFAKRRRGRRSSGIAVSHFLPVFYGEKCPAGQ